MGRVITSLSVPTSSVIADVAAIIRAGGVVAAPTESSYALCASPFDAAAAQRIVRIKGRPQHKPILVLVSRREQLAHLVAQVPPAAEILIGRCWPGPLTLVLAAVPTLPSALTAGTGTIGVRLPNYPPLIALLDAVGPLTGTSANRSGTPALTSAREVMAALGDEVDAVFNPGSAGGAPPSTLIEVGLQAVRVIREGPVSAEHLRALLTPSGYDVTT